MWSLRTASTNLNGPVPTGCWLASQLYCLVAAGLMMPCQVIARLLRKGALASGSVNRSVYSSTTSILATVLSVTEPNVKSS